MRIASTFDKVYNNKSVVEPIPIRSDNSGELYEILTAPYGLKEIVNGRVATITVLKLEDIILNFVLIGAVVIGPRELFVGTGIVDVDLVGVVGNESKGDDGVAAVLIGEYASVGSSRVILDITPFVRLILTDGNSVVKGGITIMDNEVQSDCAVATDAIGCWEQE